MACHNLNYFALILCISLPQMGASDVNHSDISESCIGELFPEVPIPDGRTEIISTPTQNTPEGSQRLIVKTVAFCISENEISVETYQSCVSDGHCSSLRGEQINPNHPVHSVTYGEVEQFLLWLSSISGVEYRLPSEAEWQRAALGGLEEQFPWRTVGRLPEVNIFSDQITPIGENSMNEFGVRDTVGNLSEFVSGCFTRDINLADSIGSLSEGDNCFYRLTKGGHYSAPDFFLSPYFRAPIPVDFSSPQIGFRVARSINPEN